MTEIGSADHSEIDADHPRSAPCALVLRYQPGVEMPTKGPTMTYQPPQQIPPYVHPGPPGFPPASIPPAKPPRSKVPTVLLVVLLIVALVLVVGLIGAVLSNNDAAAPKAAATTTAATPTTEAAAAEPVAPDPANFAATPRIVSKKCFGSAGCNVSLRIDLATSVRPEPGVSWLVVYEIHGVESGPQIGNLTVSGDTFESSEEHVGTASSKSKITVKVVSVEIA